MFLDIQVLKSVFDDIALLLQLNMTKPTVTSQIIYTCTWCCY